MKQEGLKYFSDLFIPALGLMIFFFVFLAVLLWTFRRGSKAIYEKIESIPLEDEGQEYKALKSGASLETPMGASL